MSDDAVERVRRALDRVVDPCSIATGVPITLADMGLVENVAVVGAEARIRLRVTSPFCMHIGNMHERIVEVVGEVPGIEAVHLDVDDGTTWLPDMMAPAARRQLRAVRPLEPEQGRSS
jgi:metal-sulfur cluster biosynthetic enzyme